VFKIGEFDNIVELDVNSMYPYVMQNLVVPVYPVAYLQNPPIETIKKLVENNIPVIARVILNIPSTVLVSPAPLRTPQRKLIFPVGRFSTVLCTPELKIALKYIEKIEECVVYKGARVFRDFVAHYYAKRLEAKRRGDVVHDLFYKIILNALYGKFGEKRREYRLVKFLPIDGEFDLVFMRDKRLKVQSGAVYEVITIDKNYGRFTAVSAFITSAARAYLYQILVSIPYEKLVYTDTDSVHIIGDFNWRSYLKLFLELPSAENREYEVIAGSLVFRVEMQFNNLGKLKVVNQNVKGIYLAPKAYQIGSQVKLKGVPKKYAKELRHRYEIERVIGFREARRRGLDTNSVYWVIDEKVLSMKNDKRHYFEDGTSKPICINSPF